MKRFVGIGLLSALVPFVFAMAFDTPDTQSVADAFYMITGVMWLVFGTWGGILLLKDGRE